MKWESVVVLLLAAMSWHAGANLPATAGFGVFRGCDRGR